MLLTTRERRTSEKANQMLIKQPLKNIKTNGMVLFVAILVVGLVSVRKRKWEQDKKSANMVVSKAEVRTFGCGNSLPIVLSVYHSLVVD